MCLELKWWSRIRVAKKDIVCYKVVTSEYKTPYYDYTMKPKPGYEYMADFNLGVIKVEFDSYGNRTVGDGVFHTLKDMDAAKEYLWVVKFEKVDDEAKILKCIIPKGSMYVKGTTDWRKHVSYGSKYLKIIEEIK